MLRISGLAQAVRKMTENSNRYIIKIFQDQGILKFKGEKMADN